MGAQGQAKAPCVPAHPYFERLARGVTSLLRNRWVRPMLGRGPRSPSCFLRGGGQGASSLWPPPYTQLGVPNMSYDTPLLNGRYSIQTEYNGITYRSKLEADWARTLDYYEIRYQYEPKGRYYGDKFYLPDFTLKDTGQILEVKGVLTPAEFDRLTDVGLWLTERGEIPKPLAPVIVGAPMGLMLEVVAEAPGVFAWCSKRVGGCDLQFFPKFYTYIAGNHIGLYPCPRCHRGVASVLLGRFPKFGAAAVEDEG